MSVSKPHSSLTEKLIERVTAGIISDSGDDTTQEDADAALTDLIEQLETLQREHRNAVDRMNAANVIRERTQEQLESYVRLLEATDVAWKWVAKHYPVAMEAMPNTIYRAVRDARVPNPASGSGAPTGMGATPTSNQERRLDDVP